MEGINEIKLRGRISEIEKIRRSAGLETAKIYVETLHPTAPIKQYVPVIVWDPQRDLFDIPRSSWVEVEAQIQSRKWIDEFNLNSSIEIIASSIKVLEEV